MWAVTSLPATESFMTPSWKHPICDSSINGYLYRVISTHKRQDLQCSFVDFRSAVGDNTDYDFLPSFGSPHL